MLIIEEASHVRIAFLYKVIDMDQTKYAPCY